MRRSHASLAIELLRRGGLKRGTRLLKHMVTLAFGGRAPLFATLAVTYRCNYACGMCDFPQRAEAEFPAKDRVIAVIGDLARGGTLAVGLTGGEPMLRKDLAEIVAATTELGLLCHVNTNGSCFTRARCDELLRARPCSINVSLDGGRAATHDALRGVPGSFQAIVAGTSALLAARDAMQSRTRVRLVMAVSRQNLAELESLLDQAAQLGVDGLGFLPVHAFGNDVTVQLSGAELETMQAALARMRAGPHARLLDNSPGYLSGMRAFFSGASMPTQCSAPRAHVAIDPWFRTHACVPMMSSGAQGQELHETPRQPPREMCERCWWNCHRELDLALHTL